jgi:hypothetical protein
MIQIISPQEYKSIAQIGKIVEGLGYISPYYTFHNKFFAVFLTTPYKGDNLEEVMKFHDISHKIFKNNQGADVEELAKVFNRKEKLEKL